MLKKLSELLNARPFVRSLLVGLGGGLVLGLAFVGGYLFRGWQQPPAPPASETVSLDLLTEADSLLNQYYLGEKPDEETRIYGAIQGLAGSYDDPYTYFVEPQEHAVASTDLAGRFGGIGASIGRDEEGHFVLVTVFRDGPGYEAGLRDGDFLVAVDGETVDITAPNSDAVIAIVRGPVGEPVVIGVLRGEEELEFEVIREEVTVPSVLWRILEQDDRIGYIYISRFTGTAPDDLKLALEELQDTGATAFIVDVRNNGGGLVTAAVDIADEFIDTGLLLREERSTGEPQTFEGTRGGMALDQPLVVLVNGGTASASEILAGTLHDYERATLVGGQTYGKGSVQIILELSNASSLHITAARWYTPDNTPLDGQGLTPDVLVEPVEGQDTTLEAGIAVLLEELGPAATGDDTDS